MKEPVRVLAGGGSRLERQLLEAAELDRMPSESLSRLSSALGMPNTVLADATSVAAMAPRGALGGLPSWMVTATLLASFSTPSQLAAPAVPFSPEAPALIEAPAAPPAPARAALEVARPSSEESARPRHGAHGNSVVRSKSQRMSLLSTAVPASAASAGDSLGAELRGLEIIQRALGRGHTDDAAAALAEYRQHFARGELSLEAELLEIDIALARGQRERAIAHARELLHRPEAAHYRQRLLAVGSESNPTRHQ